MAKWEGSEIADLRRAVELLERTNFLVKLTDFFGDKIEKFIKKLPKKARDIVDDATRQALEGALRVAILTFKDNKSFRGSDLLHKGLSSGTGFIGGAFSWAGLAFELPITTILIFRSIADIARDEGENLSSAVTRLECMSVFAFSGPSNADDASETSYYATRASLAEAVSFAGTDIGKEILKKHFSKFNELLIRIAGKYAPLVSEKAAVESAPLLGAVGGAIINPIFMMHFQDKARGHFIVRRLERKFGPEQVRVRYERYEKALTKFKNKKSTKD